MHGPVCAGGSLMMSQKHHRHSSPPWVYWFKCCSLLTRAGREDLTLNLFIDLFLKIACLCPC